MQSEPDIAALLGRLARAGVDFVVIGGVAVIAHGYERITKDLDICYSPEPTNLETLGQVLVELGAQLRGLDEDVPFVPDARTLRRTQILTLHTPEGGLDLLVDPNGSPGYEELKRKARHITFEGCDVLIASIPDLLAMKRAANRPQDQTDIEALTAIQRLQREAPG
jgi:predicted nucleotidyltransferase